MLRGVSLLLCLLLLSTASLGFDGAFRQFEKKLKSYEGFEAAFTQEYKNGFDERVSLYQGIFRYKRPGLMRWEYTEPDPQEVIVGKDKVWVVDPILESVIIQPLDNVRQMNSLAFIFGDERLEGAFVKVKAKEDHLSSGGGLLRYHLRPKEESPYVSELQLGIDPKSLLLREFVVLDNQRNYRKIILRNLTQKPGMQASLFEYLPGENMEVIDKIAP